MNKKRKNVIQIIQLIQKIDKFILPLYLLSAAMETILPFINIGMPAIILDALIKKEGKEKIFTYVMITVLLNVVILLILAVLNQLKGRKSFHFMNLYRWEKTKKILSMDYQYLEDVDFISLKLNIKHNDDDFGTMSGMPGKLAGLFRTCLSMAIASTAFFLLLYQIVISSKEIGEEVPFPWSLPLLIVFILVSIIVVKKMQQKVGEKVPLMTDEIVTTNRVGMYLAESVVHNYSLGKDVRIYGIDKLVIAEMEKMEKNFSEFQKKTSAIISLPGAISGASSAIISGLIFVVISVYALDGKISLGSVVWTAGVVQQFIQSVSGLIFGIGDFSISCIRLQSVLELLNLPKLKKDQNKPVVKSDTYEIEFRKVSFRYPKSDKWVLQNFSLIIESGKRIAVVGMNGSGKTTMIKLLCRLYDPTEGEILINGIDIKELSEREYLSLFSVVFQDFKLFSFSLGENISTGMIYNKVKTEKALISSGFGERLKRLPQGLCTPLYRDFDENGVEISGGEAQKLAIARSLYLDAPIIILDEPTAALDPIAEQEVYENFDKMVGGKTSLYISHRLSSCRFCDCIIVIDKGKMIQNGSHNELVAQREGKYFELWNAQAQYYDS